MWRFREPSSAFVISSLEGAAPVILGFYFAKASNSHSLNFGVAGFQSCRIIVVTGGVEVGASAASNCPN